MIVERSDGRREIVLKNPHEPIEVMISPKIRVGELMMVIGIWIGGLTLLGFGMMIGFVKQLGFQTVTSADVIALIVFSILWTGGIGYSVYRVLWSIFGVERVIMHVSDRVFRIQKELFGRSHSCDYDASTMRNLRTIPWANGSILFEYERKTIRFGENIETDQKEIVYSVLNFIMNSLPETIFTPHPVDTVRIGIRSVDWYIQHSPDAETPLSSPKDILTDRIIYERKSWRKCLAWSILIIGDLGLISLIILGIANKRFDIIGCVVVSYLGIIWNLIWGYLLAITPWGVMLKEEGLLVFWTKQQSFLYPWEDVILDTIIESSHMLRTLIFVKEKRWQIFTQKFPRLVSISTTQYPSVQLPWQIYMMRSFYGKLGISQKHEEKTS